MTLPAIRMTLKEQGVECEYFGKEWVAERDAKYAQLFEEQILCVMGLAPRGSLVLQGTHQQLTNVRVLTRIWAHLWIFFNLRFLLKKNQKELLEDRNPSFERHDLLIHEIQVLSSAVFKIHASMFDLAKETGVSMLWYAILPSDRGHTRAVYSVEYER